MLLGSLSLQDTPAMKDTWADSSVHPHGAHPSNRGIPAGPGNSYYWFLWNFSSQSPESRVVAPPQEPMNLCDIWQLEEDPQHQSQVNGKYLSTDPYLVSCTVFSPARSSVVYLRRGFLGKPSALCTFGFLPVWETASAFTTWWWSQSNPHHLLSEWQIPLPSLHPLWWQLPSLRGPPLEQHIGS